MQFVEPPASALVVGGSGFVGSHLLRHLSVAGARTVLSADIRAPRLPVKGVQYLEADIRGSIQSRQSVDVIYNLAAVHTTPGHEPHEYYEANVNGALAVTDYARRAGASTIVFTSSISVYGTSEERKDEASRPAPTSDYGRSKLMAEDIHRVWLSEDDSRKLIVVRPAVIFGRGEGGNFDRMRKLIGSRRFIYPGRTDTVKACGYVEELVSSIEWVRARTERYSLFNFCYPERTTLKHIAETIAMVEGVPAPRLNLPFAAMLQAARPFEFAARAGVETGINRARLRKLVVSTDVFPGYLVAAGYPYGTSFTEGVRRWLTDGD